MSSTAIAEEPPPAAAAATSSRAGAAVPDAEPIAISTTSDRLSRTPASSVEVLLSENGLLADSDANDSPSSVAAGVELILVPEALVALAPGRPDAGAVDVGPSSLLSLSSCVCNFFLKCVISPFSFRITYAQSEWDKRHAAML